MQRNAVVLGIAGMLAGLHAVFIWGVHSNSLIEMPAFGLIAALILAWGIRSRGAAWRELAMASVISVAPYLLLAQRGGLAALTYTTAGLYLLPLLSAHLRTSEPQSGLDVKKAFAIAGALLGAPFLLMLGSGVSLRDSLLFTAGFGVGIQIPSGAFALCLDLGGQSRNAVWIGSVASLLSFCGYAIVIALDPNQSGHFPLVILGHPLR